MNIELSFILGAIGVLLAIVEIWKPRLSVRLESYIDYKIDDIEKFQKIYIKEFRSLAKVADKSMKKVLAGPKLVTPEEFKTNTLESVMNIKSYLWFYFATFVNFFIFKPIKFMLIFLNWVGKGRAVGGIGVLIGILSLCL